MSGRLLVSSTINGEYGPDNDAATTGDNGTEYTDGKTTNGTARSSGAYVQYDFTQGTPPSVLYWYDGNTGSNAGAGYGGSERYLAQLQHMNIVRSMFMILKIHGPTQLIHLL